MFLSEMGNGIPNRRKTAWPNTDTRLNPKQFYAHGVNRGISSREIGWVEALNDFMEHISPAGELKHDEGTGAP